MADRPEGFRPEDPVPFKNMIPLDEIIADAFGQNVGTKAVDREYEKMVEQIGPELSILFDRSREELAAVSGERVVDGILRVREGRVEIQPGYDGVYGKIQVFKEEEKASSFRRPSAGQMELF